MNQNCKQMTKEIVKNLARKVAESAVNAAVFAYISNKVNDLLDKNKNKKVRVNDSVSQ